MFSKFLIKDIKTLIKEFEKKTNNDSKVNPLRPLISEWLNDWLVFKALSALCQPFNDSKTAFNPIFF